MLRAEVTIFRDSDLPEDEARDNIVSILDAYGVDVTRVKFQEIKTDKDEKRLWKFKLTYSFQPFYGPPSSQEDLSEVRELTTDEAINWIAEYIKQKPRHYNSTSLYYKKDGEWVLYENKVNKRKISKRS